MKQQAERRPIGVKAAKFLQRRDVAESNLMKLTTVVSNLLAVAGSSANKYDQTLFRLQIEAYRAEEESIKSKMRELVMAVFNHLNSVFPLVGHGGKVDPVLFFGARFIQGTPLRKVAVNFKRAKYTDSSSLYLSCTSGKGRTTLYTPFESP